jgi:hypothetical protein
MGVSRQGILTGVSGNTHRGLGNRAVAGRGGSQAREGVPWPFPEPVRHPPVMRPGAKDRGGGNPDRRQTLLAT